MTIRFLSVGRLMIHLSMLNSKGEVMKDHIAQIQAIANAERLAGGSVVINNVLPTVSVITSAGDEYFFQEHEAEILLGRVPADLSAEDHILYSSTNW